MAGLRERQKEERRLRISEVATALFVEKGFQSTKLEEIAAAAGLSVPTVCKYFPSKQTILLELVQQADEDAMAAASATIDLEGDPVEVLCRVESCITERSVALMPPALWREVLPLLLFSQEASLPESYRAINQRLVKAIQRVLEKLQQAGKFRADVDIHYVAYMLNEYSHLQLSRLVATDELDFERHRAEVYKLTQLVVQGMV